MPMLQENVVLVKYLLLKQQISAIDVKVFRRLNEVRRWLMLSRDLRNMIKKFYATGQLKILTG